MMEPKLFKKKRTARIRPALDPDPPPPPPQPPVDARRSLRPRRRRPLPGDYFDDDYDVGVDDDDDEDEGRRKLKLVLKLPVNVVPSRRSYSSSDGEEEVKPMKKRRIEESGGNLDGSGHRVVTLQGGALKRRNVVKRAISGTRLPEKAVLLEVLDKLQKKDTYSVFARPVDLDELPDYHDVIEHPMDFVTVRRKLGGGMYRSFEQFQDDVFLICSNAMQYNASDTIYFRQAHSIQDLARKKFQELRADCISSEAPRKTEVKTTFHSVEKKTLKKPQCRNASESFLHDTCSMEKIIKKPHCRTAPDQHGSDFPLKEKRILKKPQYRPPKPVGSDFSSLDKTKLKDVNGIHAPKSHGSNFSSMEKNIVKEPCGKSVRELPVPDVSSLKKKMRKKPQSGITSHSLDSDVSSEKTSNKLQYRTAPKPPNSDNLSLEKKTLKTSPCRTAPRPLGSDSSGASLASAAGTCTDMSRLHAQGLASSAETCTGLRTVQRDVLPSAIEARTGLSLLQSDAIERSVTINGSVDGSSSLDESKSEKTDEVPAKSSPSKLAMNPFEVDVNRRETYNTSDQDCVVEADSVFDVFEAEPRELVAVDLQSQHPYARSLARFAASLGPIGWQIASKIIEQALPPGVKFGPGWVGEYEPLPTPVLHVGNMIQHQRQHQIQIQQKPQQQQQQQRQILQQQQQRQIQQRAQQQRQIQQPQIVSRKDRGNEAKLKTTQNNYHKNMPFCLQSQASSVKLHNITSNGAEGTNCELTQGQKQGLFGIDLARQPAINSSFPQHRNQANSGFSDVHTDEIADVHTDEIAARRPQSSSKVTKSKFPQMILRVRNQVQAEPHQQLPVVTPQRINEVVGMNVVGLSTWRSSDNSCPNTSSGIISSQQSGVEYWFPRGSQEQATNDPLKWMNSSGKNASQSYRGKVCNNNLERPMLNIVQSPRQENPNAAAAQAWMSIGAPAEWKSIDSGAARNRKVESASFNSAWHTPTSTPRVPEDFTKIKPESFPSVSEASQVQNKGLVIFPQLMTTDLSRLRSPWQGLVQHSKQKDQLPPDLNISFQPPGSPARPSSGIHIDSQQPDLALQL